MKSYQDWTPEEAELVRRHFLGPLLHDIRWKDMPLRGVVVNIPRLRRVTEEERHLINQALHYSDYWKNRTSSTASPTAVVEPASEAPSAAQES